MSVTWFSPTVSPAVLSWDVIIGILSEEDYISDREDIKDESAYIHTVGFKCHFLDGAFIFVVGIQGHPDHSRS
jgi:hypothetical protein